MAKMKSKTDETKPKNKIAKKLTKTGEDNLKAIYNLSLINENVRSVDIAKILLVAKASTFRALQNLSEQGYIEKENYGTVTLTEMGKLIAKAITKKYNALLILIKDVLKISSPQAETDACEMEHCIGDETTEKLLEFLSLKGYML